MLRTALSFDRPRSHLTILSHGYKRLLPLLSSLLPFTLFISPAMATTAALGVVKSQENTKQWTEITNRLQATGVNYCILNLADWQQESDLPSVKILFLPNVENLTGAQALALDKWINQGGKVIVSGPTGNLSQPEVRSKLRSLFGGYWGFGISAPSTLELSEDKQQAWVQKPGLSSTLVGGVIIPTGVKSQIAAVWLAESKPPAVVVTDKSTFLGWRWGIDAVAPASLDIAWLQAALSRYGISRSNQSATPGTKAVDCNTSQPTRNPLVPNLSNIKQQSLSPLPYSSPPTQNLSPLPYSSSPTQSYRQPIDSGSADSLTVAQITAMNQELSSLIERAETNLLSADASNSGINISTYKAIEEFLSNASKTTNLQTNNLPKSSKTYNSSAHQAVLEAKAGLQNFRQLINQQDYTQARQQWLQARRTLWDNYPTQLQVAQPEIRAMWLDRGTIVQARSEADLAKIFDQMAKAGINTVFFETINASYPIYPSRIAPEQNPLTRGWDPLQAAVKLAHERGMELHAWVWVFAAANQGHNRVLNQPLEYLGPVLSRNPDWAMTDRDGDFFDHSSGYKKAFLDPANPEVQRYLLALLDEITRRYDVDGIQLDYIRYPFQNPRINQTFGYGKASRQLFKDMTGVDPVAIAPGHPLWEQWTGFRIRQVDNFVAAASAQIKRQRPNLSLSVAVFPIPYRDRLFRLQQNWEEWGRNNWVDMIVLMTYALDTDNLEEMTQPLFNRSVAGSSLVLPGLRLLKVPDSVTIDQLQLLRNMPTGGYALFAAENLTPNLQTIFNRTQGATSGKNSDPLPHRQPFKATAARYQALQQEWSFMLSNHQLVMQESTLKEWGRQADALALALNQLADQPSQANFASAQSTLATFRRQFSNWMRRQKETNPYQVQVWENRLETLERLLAYGERVVLQQGQGRLADRQ